MFLRHAETRLAVQMSFTQIPNPQPASRTGWCSNLQVEHSSSTAAIEEQAEHFPEQTSSAGVSACHGMHLTTNHPARAVGSWKNPQDHGGTSDDLAATSKLRRVETHTTMSYSRILGRDNGVQQDSEQEDQQLLGALQRLQRVEKRRVELKRCLELSYVESSEVAALKEHEEMLMELVGALTCKVKMGRRYLRTARQRLKRAQKKSKDKLGHAQNNPW